VNVLHCKNPLIFGACVQLCFSFRIADVLHVENLLYLSLVLNLFFDSALPMNCIAKGLLYLALVVNCPFCLALLMCCIAKNSYLALICVELRLSFRTAHELHCETPLIFAALCSISSFVYHL